VVEPRILANLDFCRGGLEKTFGIPEDATAARGVEKTLRPSKVRLVEGGGCDRRGRGQVHSVGKGSERHDLPSGKKEKNTGLASRSGRCSFQCRGAQEGSTGGKDLDEGPEGNTTASDGELSFVSSGTRTERTTT